MLELKDTVQNKKQTDGLNNKSAINKTINFIYQKKAVYWKKLAKEESVKLFHFCVKNISAYKNFTEKAKILPDKIKKFEDFQTLVPVNKDNYLRSYLWQKLLPEKSLADQSLVLTSTSGSTGTPFYFPRNGLIDFQSAVYHEIFLRNSKLDSNKSSLVIVCFGMGVWIGGTITYQAFKMISEKDYPFTIITPGVNKKEIFEALKNIAPKYDQIVLCGYPPFMKDVVDEAEQNDVNWKKLDLKIIFAAETFSENFRDYIVQKTGIKNSYRDTMNIYGSADLGTMAIETPISILVRRLALKNKNLYKKIFGETTRLPTLAQYIPQFINFESVNRSIYCTGDNVLPLVRYEIGDNGGVVDFDVMNKIFKEEGFDLKEEIEKVGIEDTVTELPFVYVYERSDFSVSLYGLKVYPEVIKEILIEKSFNKFFTGKLTLAIIFDKNQNQFLEVNIEKQNGKKISSFLKHKISKKIVKRLREKNSEFRELSDYLNERAEPKVVLWPYGDQKYFKVGIKQKWTKK